jgi:hypothetical protein
MEIVLGMHVYVIYKEVQMDVEECTIWNHSGGILKSAYKPRSVRTQFIYFKPLLSCHH